jgi:hypothetical protein
MPRHILDRPLAMSGRALDDLDRDALYGFCSVAEESLLGLAFEWLASVGADRQRRESDQSPPDVYGQKQGSTLRLRPAASLRVHAADNEPLSARPYRAPFAWRPPRARSFWL